MGYLNNASVTVDAILTTKGREKLAAGTTNGLGIAYFALGDDEVDYDLWNPAHPLGSDYYGIVIENMPVLEASPIPDQNLKSKLITLPKGTATLAKTVAVPSTLTDFKFRRTSTGDVAFVTGENGIPVSLGLQPNTFNNNTLGFTIYYDPRYFEVGTTQNITDLAAIFSSSNARTTSIGDNTSLKSLTIPGTNPTFTVYPLRYAINTAFPGTTVTLNIIAQGNELGGTVTIPVVITFV
jgi:hypothetical protein